MTSRRTLTKVGSSAVAFARQYKSAAVGLVLLLVLATVAIAASWFVPTDPLAQDLSEILAPPSANHPFGTDELGRDLLSRVIHGSRVSLLAAGVATLGAGLLGSIIGLISAFLGGWLDSFSMRVMDFLLAVPAILLAMSIAAILGAGFGPAVIAVTVISIPTFARLTRASALAVKEEEFVLATEAAGASRGYLMFLAIAPNVLDPIIVQASVTAADAILLEAALSFLGLGTQPPTPSWGGMLSVGKSYLGQAPTYALFPGIVLTATVLSVDALGRGLRSKWGRGGTLVQTGRGA